MVEGLTRVTFMGASKRVLDFHFENLDQVRTTTNHDRVFLIYLNHIRNVATFQTIRDLAEKEIVADIYTLSRSMFESVITMGLLSKELISDDMDRYINRQFVDGLRRYNHLMRLGFEHHSGIPPDRLPLADQELQKYPRKRNAGADTWSGLSLEQSAKLLDGNCQPTDNQNRFYEYLYCQVYRTGSYLAHSGFAGISHIFESERISPHDATGTVVRMKPNQVHLSFAALYSILVFLSSIRFLGGLSAEQKIEDFYQDMASGIISIMPW